MVNDKYWDKREKDWINSQIRKDIDFDKAIATKYDQLELQMYKEVQSFYVNYAKATNITYAEAKKRVSRFDVNEFSKEATKLVKSKDFSPEANERLKLYNATMRINRQTMLASKLGLEAAKVSNNYEGSLRDKLEKDIYDEAKHQTGILGKTVPKHMDLRVKTLVDSSFQGAKWSDRLWVNNDQLVSSVGDIINQSLIAGMNPSQLATKLRPHLKDAVSSARYAAQRLARTESSRVSTEYKQGLYKDEGFTKGKWIAEPTACKLCLPKDGHVYDLDDINIPYHANCRCSFVPYMSKTIVAEGDEPKRTDVKAFDPMDKSTWPDSVDVVKMPDGIKLNFNAPDGRYLSSEWLSKLQAEKGDDLIDYIEYQMSDGRFGDKKQYKAIADWIQKAKEFKTAKKIIKVPSKYKKDIFKVAKSDASINKLGHDKLVNIITDDFGMKIHETSTNRLSDIAMQETIKTFQQFGNIYNLLPEKIPTLNAVSPAKSGKAAAWYSSSIRTRSPQGFSVNTKYFKDRQMLDETVKNGVNGGWFSKNSDGNHVMLHELSHHIDIQLSKLNNGKSFSYKVFKDISKSNPDFKISGISNYASTSYEKQAGSTVEPFAEIMAEAYGPTPGKQAQLFKKYYEKDALEVLNNASYAGRL